MEAEKRLSCEDQWKLEGVPSYHGEGSLSENIYSCGEYLQRLGDTVASMQVVEHALEMDYMAYLLTLQQDGFSLQWKRQIERNLYTCFCKAEQTVFVSYIVALNRIEIITERGAVSKSEFSYPYEPKARERSEFYLYGLPMDPGGYNPNKDPEKNTTGLPNCGMLMVLKCADNSVILVDGGTSSQVEYGNTLQELDEFLHRITGKRKNETVRISCWYLTHFHSDHVNGFYELLKAYPERYSLERVLCNLPVLADYPTMNNEKMLKLLSALIAENYPQCMECKAHTGMQIQLADVTLDVLYTHENSVNGETGISPIRDSNDTTTVVKATAGGMSLMILGDINQLSEQAIVASFGEDTLKSSLVQEAHHNFNYLEDIYRLIHAPILWFAQTEKGIVKNEMTTRNSETAKQYSEKFYFSGEVGCTVGFAEEKGGIREIYRHSTFLSDL